MGLGIIVGLILGALTSSVLTRLDDHLIETTMTMTLAFGAYVVATLVHASGILAVVAAGIYVGSVGLKRVSPTTQIALDNFWEVLSFIANSIVFLLIGLRIELVELFENAIPILIAILAVLLSRGLVGEGVTLGRAVASMGLHAITARRLAGRWHSGPAGDDWLRLRVDEPPSLPTRPFLVLLEKLPLGA